jgi:hypothetical protein
MQVPVPAALVHSTKVTEGGTDGPFLEWPRGSTLDCRDNLMVQESIQTELFVTLVQHYEHDPREFVRLPQQTVDSSVARIAVAELRNEGYVEEQVRGVVRLTPRGYQVFRSKPLPAA